MSATPTWLAVEKHANERIEAVKDALTTAPAETVTSLQAEVRVWRSVLALATTLAPDTQVAAEPFQY